MKITFLGTGTSTGVPEIGCTCQVCQSSSEKDKRLRTSVLLSDEKQRVLIDCGPDFRQQALRAQIHTLDAILITHEHYDHVGGIDDIRPMGNAKIYAEKRVLDAVKRTMPYCFSENKYPGVPQIDLYEVHENQTFQVGDWTIEPIRVMHGKLPILGYRVGDIAYLTDVKTVTEEAMKQLEGLSVLVINALRPKEHPSHISLPEAMELVAKLDAKKVYFTHFSHHIGLYDETSKLLPDNVFLAYDQLEINLEK